MISQQPGSYPHLTVFKGGTAFNSLLKEYHKQFPCTSYVVPISDDGGSSREICRVFGGPSIGDLRSTLTRISDDTTPESFAVKRLLEHRLSAEDLRQAAQEWQEFLEDRHALYDNISSSYKELIRCFLCKFDSERLQRNACKFDLRNGSIGNFFFTGARIVLGSLETAIFVYKSVARIPELTQVVPLIDNSDRLTIAARLANEEIIIGQNEISHPSQNGIVKKAEWSSLPSPIRQVFYVNKYFQPIFPKPVAAVTEKIRKSDGIIYGIGSFWTSIAPSLIVDGVGEEIAKSSCPKIGMLNSCPDRETEGITARKYIMHLTDTLNRYGKLNNRPQDYMTHLLVLENSTIPIEYDQIDDLGIRTLQVSRDPNRFLMSAVGKCPVYSAEHFVQSIDSLINSEIVTKR